MQSLKGGAKKALTLLTSVALALGTGVGMASADTTAGKVFMSFSNDSLGLAAAAGGFEDGSARIIDSTHLDGKSLEFTKGGAKAWSGVNLLVSSSTSYHYADADHTTITMDYWSNDSGPSPVMLKLETSVPSWQGGPWVAKALEAQPGLNHLSFDMSTGTGWDATKDWVVVSLFPDFKADDAGYSGADALPVAGQLYEVDNVAINGGTSADVVAPPLNYTAPSTLMTFENGDNLGAAAITGGFEGATASIAAAPAGGLGGNALQIIKAGNAWSGVNLVTFPEATQLLDATHHTITLNYYSPESVKTPVQVNVISSTNATIAQAVEASPGWQVLTVDMSTAVGYSADAHYIKVALFPDFVNKGDVPSYAGADAVAPSGKKFYLDNVAFNGAVTPAIPTAVAPVNKTAASVAGTAKVGRTLTAAKGTWTGTPTPSYSYKWYRCTISSTKTATTAPTSAMKCSLISTAKTASYKVVTADVGKYLRVLVTATNSKGTKYSLTKTSLKVVK